jgi:hypothetical protein
MRNTMSRPVPFGLAYCLGEGQATATADRRPP